MSGKKRQTGAIDTIWHVPDELWELLEPLIHELDPPKKRGRPRVEPRGIVDALIFRMRTGIQWNQLPSSYPDDSTVHRTMQRWQTLGLFEKLWALLVEHCEVFEGVAWEWQAADCSMGKARFGGTWWVRTQRTGPNLALSAASL
jgi:putative transposase